MNSRAAHKTLGKVEAVEKTLNMESRENTVLFIYNNIYKHGGIFFISYP